MRPIDADALKKAFCNHCDGDEPCTEPCVDIGLIETAPTVDAVPVVHGHWEIVPNDKNTDDYYEMRCSVCGGTLWSIQSEELYCCKCGAKMDGEQ